MRLYIDDQSSAPQRVAALRRDLRELGFGLEPEPPQDACAPDEVARILVADSSPEHGAGALVDLTSRLTLLEQALRCIPLDFDALPLLVEGDSKIVRSWTPHVVVERFKPTVYSYTYNRYGQAPGTEVTRAEFSAEVFRRIARIGNWSPHAPRSAYLGLIYDDAGPLLVQRKVDASNLEVRVKRYHIGSPLHRYRYTEKYPTALRGSAPLQKWSRFEQPVVCFDWRNPLTDDQGERLADEPISDDYASVWLHDARHAKEMVRSLFMWLEEMFDAAGFVLVDFCVFVDRHGRLIYGEISPDCMRVRRKSDNPEHAAPLDKDLWRRGDSQAEVALWYRRLYLEVFGHTQPAVHLALGPASTRGDALQAAHVGP